MGGIWTVWHKENQRKGGSGGDLLSIFNVRRAHIGQEDCPSSGGQGMAVRKRAMLAYHRNWFVVMWEYAQNWIGCIIRCWHRDLTILCLRHWTGLSAPARGWDGVTPAVAPTFSLWFCDYSSVWAGSSASFGLRCGSIGVSTLGAKGEVIQRSELHKEHE